MGKSHHHHARDGVGVGGRLKQRLAQILLHSSCTTTSATTFVSLAKTNAGATGAASRQELPPATPFCAPCAHQQRPKLDGVRRPLHRRSAPLVYISIDCSGIGITSGRRSVGEPIPVKTKDAKTKGKSNSKTHESNKKQRSPSYSCLSSTFTDDELAPFTSDEERAEEAEMRTLFSSLSFSSDSTSEFYSNTSTRKHHRSAPRRVPRRAPPRRATREADVFRPVVSVQAKHNKHAKADKEGDVGAAAGVAVVKRSSNPYADFQSSMVEMVVERRICRADEMSDLLASYLSLNSRRHHPAILAAFEDVWEAVFGHEP